MSQEPAGPAQATVPVCYRHTSRETYVRCARCDRPICPDCMIPASVGFQCPECVAQGRREVREPRTVFGGRRSSDPGYVTKAIIGVTAVVFLLQFVLGSRFTHELWLIGLVRDPVLGGDLAGVAAGEWYRLLSVALLHDTGFVAHILFNMYALWVFGPQLEATLGRLRFVALYLLSALGGSAASYAFSESNQPSVGASGAIFGLFAAYMVVGRKLGRDISGLVVLLVLNVVLGFTIANIDWRAHAGGFLAGGLVALAYVHAPRARRNLVQAGGAAMVALVVLVGVTVRTAELTASSSTQVVGCLVTAPLQPQQSFPDCLFR